MKWVRFFTERTTLFWSLMVGIIIAGVISYVQMPKLEDPVVAVKQAMVVVSYPGASAHDVELEVAIPLEDVMRTLPDVKKIKSECYDQTVMMTVEFWMSVPVEELEQRFDLLRRKVNDLSLQLPQGCTPIVIDDMMDVYGIFYAFTGDGYTYPELYKYAKLVRRELLTVDGVKRVSIAGNWDEEISITLSKEKVSRNGVLPSQIMMSLNGATSAVDGGSYENVDDNFRFVISGEAIDENDLRDLQIQTLDGKIVRLGDIATVERNFTDPQRQGFFFNGQPALAICVAMEADAIVPDVGELVDAKMAETLQNLPVGMELHKEFFQPDKVNTAVHSFLLNLLESVLIVIVVLIFSMGWRSGVIIGFGLVLTIAMSFPLLLACGTTLHRISLGAFIIAMGMLVDNAIVIMDGILVDKKRGLPPDVYLFRIGKQTAMPLLGATVIAASTFLCVFLSPGSTGEYTSDLFLVLCFSLLSSWVLALVQVPICAKSWFPSTEKSKDEQKSNEKKGELMNSPLHRFVRRSVTSFIAHKTLTIVIAVLALGLCGFGMTKVKNLFFPDFDYKQFVIEVFMPAQSDPEAVKAQLIEMSEVVMNYPQVDQVAASMSTAPARYCLVRPMTSGGDCYYELMVDCADFNTVKKVAPKLRDMLREKYPDSYIRTRHYNFSISTSHTVEVEFSGPDPAVLRDLARQAEDIMRQSPYVDPYSVQNNWKPRSKVIVAEYDRQNALSAGIERSDIGTSLLAATDGKTIGVIYDQDKLVQIKLKVRNEDGSRIRELGEIPVWSTMNVHVTDKTLSGLMTGSLTAADIQDDVYRATTLSNVTDSVYLSWDEGVVFRSNGQRCIEAECDPNTDMYQGTPAKLLADIAPAIDAIPLPAGYSRKWIGEQELQNEGVSGLYAYIPITVFMILILLLLLFNSWKKLGLILVCLPFVICGIVPMLLIFSQPFTFMAIVGVEGLMGMMAKNSIVLVDEIGRLINEEHYSPYRAVVDATVSRVRPVIMASLTTIVGMVPLIPDPMYGSMAIVIMGGLAVGTIITLLLLPLFYTAFYSVKPENSEQ